jgi:heme-degrading monooxygenase HmoA
MNRRAYLKTVAAAGLAGALEARGAGKPIQLQCDLEVAPGKGQALEAAFQKTFSPVIRKQPGFVDVKLLKLRHAVVGEPPTKATYKLLISFQTEEQRLAWVATDDHQRVWPAMEKNLTKFNAILYDQV